MKFLRSVAFALALSLPFGAWAQAVNSTDAATKADIGKWSNFPAFASASSNNNAPAGTTSTTFVMAGVGMAFTPTASGKALINWCAGGRNSTAGDSIFAKAAYGTGTAPTNGAAFTGTVVGSQKSSISAGAGNTYTMCGGGIVTGLTVNTAYWVDLQFEAGTGGTATLSTVDIWAVEVP